MALKMNKWLIIIGLLIVSLLVSYFFIDGEDQKTGVAILIFIGGLWVTETVPLAATALLVPILAALFHIFTIKDALMHFANPVIFVFIGGFTLATVLNEHGIDKWIAGKLIHISRGNKWTVLVSMLGFTSFLSMWMSNTATTAMLLPISMSLVDKKFPRARIFVILGTAYAANIGGIATLIGSPPNLIAGAVLNIDFITWMKFGLPVTILFFPILLIILRLVIKPEKDFRLDVPDKHPGQWTRGKSMTMVFFFSVVVLWIGSQPISRLLGLDNFDSIVAVTATALAPILGLTTWKRFEKTTNWGVLMLFGGGLCLSAILAETGTSEMIAKSILSNFGSGQGLLLLFFAVLFMVFLTEISSNTGSAAIMVPIIMEVALQFNQDFVLPMVIGIGIAADCAFMLPVATPPNALAFSSNEFTIGKMMKTGFFLNLAAIILIWLITSFRFLNPL
ncbi:MAG: SLC13/DASS family transporter [Bacteroidales bacterium]|nr:SLC13/DASS family transporter [Bacteroidales bacterium]